MSGEIVKSSPRVDRLAIEAIRAEASGLLAKLDESELLMASARMASTIDAIDEALRRLATPSPSTID